jgi:hypothetical protein
MNPLVDPVEIIREGTTIRYAFLGDAAREMYDACKEALTAIDAFWPKDAPENEGQASEDRAITAVRKHLRAAIAKAEAH